jgi:hypothetical protein
MTGRARGFSEDERGKVEEKGHYSHPPIRIA